MNEIKRIKGKNTKYFICFSVMMTVFAFTFGSLPVYADGEEVVTGINSLYETFGSIVSSIGGIICLWGFMEVGTAMQSNEGTMMSGAIKRIVGGLILVFAPSFVTLIGGGAGVS